MTDRELAEAAQDHDINDDDCRKHGEPLYSGWCKACAAQAITNARTAPIDMLLFCPNCDAQHVDEPKPGQIGPDGQTWTNPPHRTHRCDYCGHHWRVADVPTNGVREIKTHGRYDSTADPRQTLRKSGEWPDTSQMPEQNRLMGY